MSDIYFEQVVNLRTNDFDTFDHLKPVALLELFQDVAGLHANKLGIGFKDSYAKGYFWVLVRNKIELFKNPIPLTNAILKTWPHEKGKVDFNREYLLEDESGNVIARGLSKWVIITTDTRRLCRANVMDYGDGEIYKNNYYDDVEKVQLPDLSLFSHKLTHHISKNDLDHNGHMNNTRYADLIFDTTNKDLFIKNLVIEYHHEALLDEDIDIYSYEDDKYIYHYGKINDEKIFSSKILKD